MIYNKHHYQIALSLLYGFGPIRSKQLLQIIGSEEEIFSLSNIQLAHVSGLSIQLIENMRRKEALEKAVSIVEQLEKFEIDIVFYTDERYPRRLRQCDDSPIVLYSKGAIDYNQMRFVAVVGTRDATDYGRKICRNLIESFVDQNIVVVSGLAFGIDVCIHKECLRLGVPTIGVVAHGLETIYPYGHRSVAKSMLLEGGLLSEYPPFTKPDREHFPMRNRIVAGMCDATIVVESKEKGGSLITASLANDYSRDVFAFPGNIFDENSAGCNELIAGTQAHLLRSGVEFISKMGWNLHVKPSIQRTIFPSLNDEEKQVVHILRDFGQMNIDSLAFKMQMPSSKLSVILFQLEMNGLVASIPGNRCQLI